MQTRNVGNRTRLLSCTLALSLMLGGLGAQAAGGSPEGQVLAETHIDLTGLTEYQGVKLATGATVTKESLLNEGRTVSITDAAYGAVALEDRAGDDADTHAIENTEAINKAILDMHEAGGGTVVFPAGTFRSYTIQLQDNVNLYLEEGCVVQAAKTAMFDREGKQTGEAEDSYADGTPGNYLQPEVNIYAGLQDGGHTHFANSLIYAADKKNIMIYGEGRLDGSQLNDEGSLDQVLMGNDPGNPADRTGQNTVWYGNKAVALVRCENVVLSGFDILNGGHFAIIMEGTKNMLVDGMVIDTNRDAFNIDCGQDVTIQNSHFNSLTDDAIVFKASYGAGVMMPVQNCLVRNCIVSGYDAGSVLAGTFTTDKQVATDRCGPTARIKFGTESTCGYNTVTITDVKFQRSRGFCLESVDGSSIHDILMVNAEMDTISSSPIFVRIGNRGRYPVTGNSTDTALSQPGNVRLTNNGWVLPQNGGKSGYTWTEYPIQRYFPAYNTNGEAEMSNGVKVPTVNQEEPVRINENNYVSQGGKYYAYKWDEAAKTYVKDTAAEIPAAELGRYGDAVGFENIATAYNIYVGNVKITNVDPRYPITLAGVVDSKIKNVTFEDIHVTYRGGIRMADAVEQQQLNTDWEYTQYMTAPTTQSPPWLVNTFFTKNAALLPRVVWDAESKTWADDPYNVPEMPEQYPEPSNFGILPAYGLYARHVEGLELKNVTFGYEIEDQRHAVVLDDCQDVSFTGFEADVKEGVKPVALVNNNYKRPTGFEYVPDTPYTATKCGGITGLDQGDIYEHTVNAPEPSTPKDSLYDGETIASTATGYAYGENVWTYNGKDFDLPVTVYRPFFTELPDQTVRRGERVQFTVSARNPAAETKGQRDQAASDATLTYSVENLPAGAAFESVGKTFTWDTERAGSYTVTFVADDGVLPVKTTVNILVTGFDDVDSDAWYADAVDYVTENGLFSGVGGGNFAPGTDMSRAMFSTVLARLDGQDTAGGDSWYAKAAAWAISAGISDGTDPDGAITREQIASMLYRYVGAEAAQGGLTAYPDAGQVSDWAAEGMAWAVAHGVITGKDGGRLAPQDTATRAEVAIMLQRLATALEK